MTATALLEGIANAVNSADPGTFPGEFVCARSWLPVVERSEKLTRLDLSWEGWELLGSAGNFHLERNLIVATLTAPSGDESNETLDPFAELRDSVIEFLNGWHDDAAGLRVLNVQAPTPYDKSRLTEPGLWQSRVLLDCDVLKTFGSESQPAAPEVLPILSMARRAVWDAIWAFPSLAEVFARHYDTDGDLAELLLRDPAPHELPAIAITWEPMPAEWWTNQAQQWQPTASLTLWLPAHWHSHAEHLAQQACLALYQATPEASTVPIIKSATGNYPKRVSPINIQPVQIGRLGLTRAIRVDVQFQLRMNLNPFGG